jgi:heat shock protein HslJ
VRLHLVVLVAVASLAACGGGANSSPSPSAPLTADATTAIPNAGTVPESLAPGQDWLLVGPDPQLATSDVTLRFGDDSNLSGKAVLNTYSGTFTASDDGSLRLGPIARTEIGGDPDLMAAEDQYFEALSLVDGFDSNGDELFLRTGDTTILRYGLPDSAAAFGATLIGRTTAKARARAEAEGYTFRVVSVDGEGKPVTQDYRPDRLNATVVDGRVTEVTVG